MPGITNGAELTKALREHGTGKDKLDVCRSTLLAAKMKDDRVASTGDIVAALAENFGPSHGTVAKAKALIETGSPVPPKPEDVPIEEQLAPSVEPKAEVKVEPAPVPPAPPEVKTEEVKAKPKKPAAE